MALLFHVVARREQARSDRFKLIVNRQSQSTPSVARENVEMSERIWLASILFTCFELGRFDGGQPGRPAIARETRNLIAMDLLGLRNLRLNRP
jgi:hypothetical protein